MRRTRLGLLAAVLALLVVFVAGVSRAGACSPLTCAPSRFALGNGSLLGVRGSADKPLRVLDLRTERPPHVAIALGYAPDQSRLWVVRERSRVTALPVR